MLGIKDTQVASVNEDNEEDDDIDNGGNNEGDDDGNKEGNDNECNQIGSVNFKHLF